MKAGPKALLEANIREILKVSLFTCMPYQASLHDDIRSYLLV